MEWLNYHHLLYFWMVAREGSIARASKELRLAQPTISGQIRQLERALGVKLFTRRGRGIVPTPAGIMTYRYADEIFSIGLELLDTVKRGEGAAQRRLVVGVSDVLAKSIAHRILRPALRKKENIRLVCRQNRSLDAFMGELATHAVDVVLSDAPAGPEAPIRLFSHLLGECGTVFFAAPALARACRRDFPRSLDGTRVLLPASGSTLRRALDEWFASQRIRPTVTAELDDAALVNIFGEAGIGVFAAPDVVEAEIRRRYRVALVGRAKQLRQRFYAISVERKISHPAVVAICDVARGQIFA